MQIQRLYFLPLSLALCSALACNSRDLPTKTSSAYPIAVDFKKVGTYSALTKSGAGYFYDDVLEYRVWSNPPAGGDDHYKAFATYEDAFIYSQKTPGAEAPLVLIRQKEWIDEPQPGQYIRKSEERLTEWKVKWLEGSKREPGLIERILKEHRQTKDKDNLKRPMHNKPPGRSSSL
jgi:putative acetyltransferase